MLSITCTATTAKGSRCTSQPATNTGFCLLHDPATKAASSAKRTQERKAKYAKWSVIAHIKKMDDPTRLEVSRFMGTASWAVSVKAMLALLECLDADELGNLLKFIDRKAASVASKVTRQIPPASAENNSPD